MRIRVVDLETCGFEPSDGVVEIAAWDVVDGEVDKSYGATLINPGQPIPAKASAVHHITDADVEGRDTWDGWWPHYLVGADALCAHNARFDRQWLTDEMTKPRPWICTLRCAYRLWPDAPGHSNQVLRYWLNPDGLDRFFANMAHRAEPDCYVTAFLLREQLKLAGLETLIKWSAEPALLPRLNFGKHKGSAWNDVPTDYLQWMTRQADLNEDVLHTARHHLQARK